MRPIHHFVNHCPPFKDLYHGLNRFQVHPTLNIKQGWLLIQAGRWEALCSGSGCLLDLPLTVCVCRAMEQDESQKKQKWASLAREGPQTRTHLTSRNESREALQVWIGIGWNPRDPCMTVSGKVPSTQEGLQNVPLKRNTSREALFQRLRKQCSGFHGGPPHVPKKTGCSAVSDTKILRSFSSSFKLMSSLIPSEHLAPRPPYYFWFLCFRGLCLNGKSFMQISVLWISIRFNPAHKRKKLEVKIYKFSLQPRP